MFEKFLEDFIPSVEMHEYLKSQNILKSIVEIIYYSPCDINKKLQALKDLEEEMEYACNTELERLKKNDDSKLVEFMKWLISDIRKERVDSIRNIEEALALLYGGGPFSIEAGYYDDSIRYTETTFEAVCTNYQDAIEYMEEYATLGEWKPDEYAWFEVKRWAKAGNGKLIDACTYIFVNGEIWYVALNDKYFENSDFECFCQHEDLNLPVPFNEGDILETGNYPFAPNFRMLLVEVGDNYDCCCLQGMAKNQEGEWTTGAIKHNMVGIGQWPRYSLLYNLSRYRGELLEEEIQNFYSD